MSTGLVWPTVALEEICAPEPYAIAGGPFGSDLTRADYVERPGVPVIRGTNLGGDTGQFVDEGFVYVTDQKAVALEKNLARPGDLVFTQRGTLGQVAIIPTAACHTRYVVSQSQMKVSVDTKRADAAFVWHYFRSPDAQRQLLRQTLATGVPHINLGILRRLTLPLPPLSEQRRIAALLDKADAIRRKRQQAIRLADDLLRSAFLDMFGDPVTNPKGWPVHRLDQVAAVNRGKFTPRPRNDPRYYGGLFPFIQTGDLSGCTGLLRTWQQTLNEAGTEVSRRFPRGTISIAIAANIGDTAILDFDSYCPDSVVGIQVFDDRATAEYVEGCLRFFQRLLREGAPETAQKNINLETLRPLPVPVPPVESQRRFSALFWKHTNTADRLTTTRGQTDRLFHALVQRTFQGDL
jgi:type I restriction enzyme S subunit